MIGNTRSAPAEPAKLAYIDNARGLAILLVVLVHCNQPVQGLSPLAHALATYGQTGVQLFFVASAFTLCLSYQKRDGGQQAIGPFLIRRLFRIAPLYYLGVLLYFGAHLFEQWSHPGAAVEIAPFTVTNVLANLLLIHGFVPSANNIIVPGGWSIGTEMAFYLCFPLLFSLFSRLYEKGIAALGWAIAFSVLLSVGVQGWLHFRHGVAIDNNSFMFYNLLNQMPVFLLGLMFYFVTLSRPSEGKIDSPRVEEATPMASLVLGLIAATALATALWLSDLALAFTLVPLAVGVSYVCLLAIMRRAKFDSRWLRAVGQVSFSIYIVHFVINWYVMDWLKNALPAGAAPEVLWLTGFVVVTACSFILALVLQRTVEARGIELGRQLISVMRGSNGTQIAVPVQRAVAHPARASRYMPSSGASRQPQVR